MSDNVLHTWTSESGRSFRMLIDGSIRLGNEKRPMLLSGWEACFARELARLAAENAKLRACVNEVDKVLQDGPCFCEDEHGIRCAFCSLWDAYDEKRAKLENKDAS